jgi:hypothetical protein
VQVYLPVHQPACYYEFFYWMYSFFLYHQLIVAYGKHLEYAVVADNAFWYTGIKAVPVQVVHPVHVQLAADELVQVAVAGVSK